MAEVTMPRLSDTMKEGVIVSWLKKEGEEIKKGDILAEIETDKATMELEAFENGVLGQILVQPGNPVKIGEPVAIIGKPGETPEKRQAVVETATPERVKTPAPAALQTQPEKATATIASPAAPHGNGTARVKASPLARKLAGEYGVDLLAVSGTGPGGRVVRQDVEEAKKAGKVSPQGYTAGPVEKPAVVPTPEKPAAAAEPEPAPPSPATGEVEFITPSTMQTTIARRMTEAKQQIPHFYVSTEVDMEEAARIRTLLNSDLPEGGQKISYNDLIVKACAIALEQMPEVNTSYRDGKFARNPHINIGVAVDVPNGLVVPVIRDCNVKGVRTISREARELAERARSGKLRLEDYGSGTFTVSNLGMFNVTQFQAVINPPESAILGVGSIQEKAVVVNHEVVIRQRMSLTLSADHRVLYGAGAARFLGIIQNLLENPFRLLG